MPFSQGRARLKVTQSNIQLTVQRVGCCFPEKETGDRSHGVKNSGNGTKGTVLFSQETVGLKFNQPKCRPRYTGYQAIFPRISKTINYPVKTSVNGTQGTMLFSNERVRLKIDPLEISVRDKLGTSLFSRQKGKNKDHPVSVNVTRLHCYFPKTE